ncbi:MAG: VCBS repeat-containing protein [Blastocatellia bacterium]|nr:VCBS repeat-containing protein [Blastocatellia bacterium]
MQDLDKDGRNEIVVNVWDGATQETRIYRGDGDQINLGQPMLLASIPSAYVWDLADLNNDGTAEFLASIESVSNPTLTLNSALKLYRPSVVGK